MEQTEIRKVRASIHQQCGNRVKIQQDLGRNKDLPRRKYFCSDCGSYHLTHLAKYDKDSYGAAWEAKFYFEYEMRGRKAGKTA